MTDNPKRLYTASKLPNWKGGATVTITINLTFPSKLEFVKRQYGDLIVISHCLVYCCEVDWLISTGAKFSVWATDNRNLWHRNICEFMPLHFHINNKRIATMFRLKFA